MPTSPLPKSKKGSQPNVTVSSTVLLASDETANFAVAILAVLDGKRVTRLEWNNPEVYIFLSTHLMIHNIGIEMDRTVSDTVFKDRPWILMAEDVRATDWVEIEA